MSFELFFAHNPVVFYGVVCLLGLMIGSFLNVVIYRLPLMMEREWTALSVDHLQEYDPERLVDPQPAFPQSISLSRPASHCPQCNTPIRAWQNIPLLSFLRQKGRCAHCKHPIPWQYPMVEFITGALSLVVALHFGVSQQTLAALALTWALVALSGIDLKTKLLPDSITLPLLWLGLLINSQSVFVSPTDAVFGAAFGYLSLWSVYQAFRLLTGKEGMGFGDFKLLAALGAWMGWQALLPIVLLSSLLGAIIGIVWIAITKGDRDKAIPFGPYLALAGWISLLWGEDLTQYYLHSVMS